MADFVDYTDKMFGTLLVKRAAQATDICKRQDKSRKIWEWAPCERHPGAMEVVFKDRNRNKYWFVVCTVCQQPDVIRSDYLSHKICQCQKK